MTLMQTFALIILALIATQYLMVNILDIPFKDLIKTPGITNIEPDVNHESGSSKLTQHDLDKLNNLNVNINDVGNALSNEFGLVPKPANGPVHGPAPDSRDLPGPLIN